MYHPNNLLPSTKMAKSFTTNAQLVLAERDGTRIHTVYLPYSFVPLLRFEGDKPPTVTPLADKLEQEVGITLPLEFKQTLHHIEQALRANRLSTEQHAWLNQVQLSPDYLATLLDPLPDTPYAAQLYDCNHLGTPQQLINLNGHIDWSITLDAWGNALSEENPHQLHQPIRMQGQQYDEESGLHYNRHRYYDPTIGRYITQDPIGLSGGWNLYEYPLNTVTNIDPLGLSTMIIGNGPVPDNPFCHGAAANRYGLMSSGTGDKVGSSVTDYLKKMQPRRDSWIWIVDTTDEQEKCMINKAKDIEKSQEKLGIALDNCFSRTNQIFEACGYSNPVMNTNSPISIQVLGELYGSHKYVLAKGPFTKLPFEFQGESK